MPTMLPTDDNNNPIPALRLRDLGAQKIAVGAASQRNVTPFDADTKVVSLYATVGVYVRLGGTGVTASATDHYFPANMYYDIAIGGDDTAQTPFIAAISTEGSGTLYISEKV